MPKFAQDLDYTHATLYRAVSGLVARDGSMTDGLGNAKVLLGQLFPSDFPQPLKRQFSEIMDTPDDAVPKLCKLFIALSTYVVNGPALGAKYEEVTWCVMEAQEGRPEPMLALIETAVKRSTPLPENVVAFLKQHFRQRLPKRRGRASRHPAETITIARMVKDRLEFHRLDNPTASLNDAAKHIASLIGKSWQSVKAAYLDTYKSSPRLRASH